MSHIYIGSLYPDFYTELCPISILDHYTPNIYTKLCPISILEHYTPYIYTKLCPISILEHYTPNIYTKLCSTSLLDHYASDSYAKGYAKCSKILSPFHFLSLNKMLVIIPPANFVCRGYTVFTLSVRPSVTFCFLNNSKSHCWIFIKPCKHVHICKTNTLDKTVRARGQFYLSYFP